MARSPNPLSAFTDVMSVKAGVHRPLVHASRRGMTKASCSGEKKGVSCKIGPSNTSFKGEKTTLLIPNPTRKALSIEPRLEEHTSELQSRQYLVCRLLLEKKIESRQCIVCRLLLGKTSTQTGER